MTVTRLVRLVAVSLLIVASTVGCQPTPVPPTPVANSSPAASLPTSTATARAVTTPTVPPVASTPSPIATPSVAPSRVPLPSSTPTPAVAPRALAIPTPPPRDLVDLQRRLKRLTTPVAGTPTPSSHDLAIGTEQTFWVANQDTKTYFQVRARIVAKTAHAYWYVQDGVELPVDDVQSAASYFEDHTYRTEHALFGSEWSPGVDGDVHITVLVAHVPGVGGYYSTADEYTRDVNPYSNEREMIYINVDAVRPGSAGFNGTVAHEFMHMIQFNVHRWQNSWIDEGSAELAAQAVTGAPSGAIGAFARQPQTQLNAWASEPSAATPHYGAAYLFMRYVAEQFGGFRVIGQVIAEPGRGMASFERFFQSLQPPRTFDQVFADWVAANVLNNPSLDGGRYGYHSLHFTARVDPGPSVGQTITGTAYQYGTSYYRLSPSGPATLRFAGVPTVQLIGADPHDSSFEWWSNRGDSIDSRLTRTVDLRSTRKATLRFWIWYDIEKDFDYGYVEVSDDGGKTWRTLPTADTTATNPNGQNYGNGFTGTSGGATPTWVQETADLSQYAGREILLRFEYVTDDSYNADGFALDGIEIPEIGLKDTAMTDDGWKAEGFVRIDNRWPETYLVEVISPGQSMPVQRLQLDRTQTGSLKLPDGRTPVIVAVSGLAPITTHTTQFQLGLERD